MIVEACRMIHDRLIDATYGVNALLATTPVDAGDSVPASFDLANIVDATQDGNVARGRLPATLPGIAITVRDAEGLENYPMAADAEADLTVVIRLGVSDNTTEHALRDLSYYLRTVVRVLKNWHLADTTVRTRNRIYLQSCTDLRMVPFWNDIGDNALTGAVIATYHIRDLTPT